MSRWLQPGTGRELHWWDGAGLRRLALALQQATAQWLQPWGGGTVPVRCEAAPVRAEEGSGWSALGHEAPAAWLQAEVAGVARHLFAEAAPGPLALQVAQECRAEGVERLARLLCSPPQPGEAMPASCAPLSGAVLAQWDAPLGWRLLLGAEAAAPWRRSVCPPGSSHAPRAPAQPLASALQALASAPLALQVELEGCELKLGALQALQPGDVVRLRHRLDRPALLRHGAMACLFSGHLGRRAGAKAVELSPAQDPS